jgi:serine/threonine protein kinase
MDNQVVSETISHYRIISKLGAGGMGEVYLAEDTRLDRQVALKLLPAEFTKDAERVRRFMQEAKAASALNHPNIITVYDIGESDAGRFIVMELVAGNTLSTIIAEGSSAAEGAEYAGVAQREQTLLSLGSQMAKALSAAHARGHHAPRHQARQHYGARRRLREDSRFRSGASCAHRLRRRSGDAHPAYDAGSTHGHHKIYVARTGAQQKRQPAFRHFFAWSDLL